ncbi:hypothetical protein J6590_094886 [Homalodisca vitripennis]|nr:hypothetical protein J6590_091119 [Homalodisca vitripennis]KAG8265435.1 hypothetical protein J6590_094886 [Homalodisca vitripennis]
MAEIDAKLSEIQINPVIPTETAVKRLPYLTATAAPPHKFGVFFAGGSGLVLDLDYKADYQSLPNQNHLQLDVYVWPYEDVHCREKPKGLSSIFHFACFVSLATLCFGATVDGPTATILVKKHFGSMHRARQLVFWDAKGIILVDFLRRGSTINTERYCETLQKLRLVDDFDWEGFDNPPYSPDLAPSDYHQQRKPDSQRSLAELLSDKVDQNCDWATILNIVLTELEGLGKAKVTLCQRMDTLFKRYSEVKSQLNELHETCSDLLPEKPVQNMQTLVKTIYAIYEYNCRTDIGQPNVEATASSSMTRDGPTQPVSSYVKDNLTYAAIVNSRTWRNKSILKLDSSHSNGEEQVSDDSFHVFMSKRNPRSVTRQQTSTLASKHIFRPKPVLGTKTGDVTRLKTAIKRSWIFISKLDIEITKSDIESSLSSSSVNNCVCEEVTPKYDSYKSFKIGFGEGDF